MANWLDSFGSSVFPFLGENTEAAISADTPLWKLMASDTAMALPRAAASAVAAPVGLGAYLGSRGVEGAYGLADALSQTPRTMSVNKQLADSAKTAEQATAPPPEAVAKQKQQEALAKETAKKNQQTEIATARTPSGAAVQDIAALELPAMMTQAEPTASKTTSDEDLSKAMLRAGIAMMASKGDIWDALAAGFSGYQGSLDAEEEAKAKKAKEDREYALDKYKTDLYGMQVQAQIANSRRGGEGGEKPPNLSQQAAYGNYMLRLQEYVTDRKDKLRDTAFDPMKSEQERALALQELSKMEGQSATPSFKK